jgi:hypothetical protein
MEIKDHDMLIKLDTQMKMFCLKLDKFQDQNREDHKNIYKLIEDGNSYTTNFRSECRNSIMKEVDKKLSLKIFQWITGFIIVGLLSLSIYITDIKIDDINRSLCNKANIEKIIESTPQVEHLYKVPDR